LDIGAWNGSGALYGTKRQVAESRRLLKRALAGKTTKLQFLDDRTLALAERFAAPMKLLTGWDLRRVLELVRPVYGLMKGIPTEHALKSVYWRKRTPPPGRMDPDRDRCGLLWCAPVAPIDGEHAKRIAGIATGILLSYRYEPALSITLLTERTLACVISIAYDRDSNGEDANAMECYRELVATLVRSGYHFYRLGIQSMEQMNVPGAYSDLLAVLKRTLDPADVLSPGRYYPGMVADMRENVHPPGS
jgi:4-cresol dehydrogenase (hydroxylating)